MGVIRQEEGVLLDVDVDGVVRGVDGVVRGVDGSVFASAAGL